MNEEVFTGQFIDDTEFFPVYRVGAGKAVEDEELPVL